ncbi:MAG: hypothetical protein JWP44_4062 [Mucilaginibacter sp.]|nr:hypothetical protein [Mucilaginibacter sp.]
MGTIVVVIGIYIVAVFNAMSFFDKRYDTSDLIKNFNEKRNEIYEVKNYINKIVPKYRNVDIEFNNDKEIGRLVIAPIDTGRGSDLTVFEDWNLKIKSKKVDSLLSILGWSNKTLDTLKEKLDDANCISVESGEPAKIGFKRSGMGIYFFNVFNKPISDSLKRKYNDSCTYIYVNNKLILEYGGGAIGPQCFPNKTSSTKPQ